MKGSLIYDLIEKAPKLHKFEAQMVLMENYETAVGMYNHNDVTVDRPLAVVAMHLHEDASVDSGLYSRIDQFIDSRVAKYTGQSLNEFLSLPTDIVIKILESCRRKLETEANIAENLENM